MAQYLSIGEVSVLIGVSVVTLRRWEKSGKLQAAYRTFGNHRRYLKSKILEIFKTPDTGEPRFSVGYARVSSSDQKSDLERQKLKIKDLVPIKDLRIIEDLGSGMNFKKRGFTSLLNLVLSKKIDKIYLTHKDRLLRFGYELIFKIASHFGTEIVILNQKIEENDPQSNLAQDLIEIITVFSSRFYGSRSHKNKKTLANTV